MSGFCPWCMRERELTDEHVIPDNLGGTITILICGECNGDLNRTFEQKATCNPLFAMARLTYGIKGRRGVPRNPLAGVGETHDGRRVMLDERMVPYLVPRISVESTDDGTKLTLSLDSRDMDRAEEFARKEIRKEILKKDSKTEEGDIERRINEALETVEIVNNTSDDNNIVLKMAVDFKPILLLAMKIAYEAAYSVYGREYVERSRVGGELRRKVLAGDCEGMVGQYNEPLSRVLFSDPSKHSIVVVEDKCIVSLFGFVFLVRVSDEEQYRVPVHNAEIITIVADTGEVIRTNYSSEVLNTAIAKLPTSS